MKQNSSKTGELCLQGALDCKITANRRGLEFKSETDQLYCNVECPQRLKDDKASNNSDVSYPDIPPILLPFTMKEDDSKVV